MLYRWNSRMLRGLLEKWGPTLMCSYLLYEQVREWPSELIAAVVTSSRQVCVAKQWWTTLVTRKLHNFLWTCNTDMQEIKQYSSMIKTAVLEPPGLLSKATFLLKDASSEFICEMINEWVRHYSFLLIMMFVRCSASDAPLPRGWGLFRSGLIRTASISEKLHES